MLLDEVLLFIGYFALENERNQGMLHWQKVGEGESQGKGLLQLMCTMPMPSGLLQRQAPRRRAPRARAQHHAARRLPRRARRRTAPRARRRASSCRCASRDRCGPRRARSSWSRAAARRRAARARRGETRVEENNESCLRHFSLAEWRGWRQPRLQSASFLSAAFAGCQHHADPSAFAAG